jgi:hypothetical protein
MKSRVPTILLLCLAACGGSDPLFGGFKPANSAAVILAPATCNLPFVGSTAISGIFVELASGADACHVLTQAQQCGTGSSSTVLLTGAFSGVPGGTTADPTGPGNYPFLANPPSAPFKASISSAAQVDAVCTSKPGSPVDMTGGTVVISTVTSSAVTGSVDLQFDNGQSYSGTFDAAVCPVSIDICSLFAPCFSHTCVPP